MDSLISKTTQSLTSAEDMRNQTKLIMQPYANWEEYLTPAPLSIAIMGELVFISSVTDFSINKNSPKDGYKYIRYPESFRACLLQVCNSGWTAFNEAHTSMDQIHLHTAQVPDYMKMAVKILFQDDDEIIQAHLPDHLNNIRVIADECLKLSTETEKHFMDVIVIIQELLEACLNAEHFYGEEREVIKKKIEENKLREKSAQEANKRTKKSMSTLQKELEKTHVNYQKAMDSLPGGLSMMTMGIIGGMTQSISALINGVTSLITHPVRNPSGAVEKISNTVSNIRGQQTEGDVVDEINSCSKSAEILHCAQAVKELMNVNSRDNDIDWKNLYDQRQKTTKTDFSQEQFKRMNDELSKINDCKGKSEAQVLCQKGINICNHLAKYAPEGKCDEDINKKIVEEVLDLINSALVFDSKCKDTTKSPAISPKPPMMYRNENRSENTSPLQQSTDNVGFTKEQNRAQLNKTTYEKSLENLEKNEKELTENCLNAEHFYGEEREVIKKKIEENKLREKSAQEANKRTKKPTSALQKELEETHVNYQKAMDSLPGGLSMMTMGIIGGMTQSTTKSPAISPKPPMMYRNENRSENTSPLQQTTDNARFAIEQNRAQLNKTRETYEKSLENLEKNEKELTEILVTLRSCEVKDIDFKTTIDMLVKGMDAMGRVKEQWEKMVRFFQMVSNIVKTSLTTTLKNFVSASEKTQALTTYNAKLFSKDLLYTQAFKACDIASLVNVISGTYTEISNKYLIDRVSSLGKLMAMDKSKPEFLQERLKLQDNCDAAQKGILMLVLKNKEEFERKSAARLERIDRELLAILPPAPPEEIKKIQEAVQAGFCEEDAESYY